MKAMLFAAGLGSRLGTETENIPKALVEVQGKTLLELALLKLKKHGFTDVVINVHHFAEKIIDFVEANDNFGMKIFFSDERGALLETGGGLRKAECFLCESQDFLLYNVDVITDLDLKKLFDFHKENDALATLAVQKRDTQRYLLFDKSFKMQGWTNTNNGDVRPPKMSISNFQKFAFSGIHILSSSVFTLLPTQKRFSIMEFYINECNKLKIIGFDHSDGLWLDVGKPATLAKANDILLPD